MKEDVFESGEISESEKLIRDIIDIEGLDFGIKVIKEVYLKNYHSSHIARGILHMISHFSFKEMNPDGELIALASLRHKDIYVIDFALKAYENWNSKETLYRL